MKIYRPFTWMLIIIMMLIIIPQFGLAQSHLRFQYDKQNRLIELGNKNRESIVYKYDNLGNRVNFNIEDYLHAAILSVSPVDDTVEIKPNSLVIWIKNSGKGTMNWKAASNNTWLSLVGKTSGTSNDSIVINYSQNTGPPRDGTVTITSKEASNSPQIISIHQAGYTNHLWHISPTGSDTTGNGSVDYPFASIQKGIDTAASGDTVLVLPGTYYENITLNSKDLKILSMWEFSGDSSDITNTIIDGKKRGRIFTLNNITSSTLFDGITLINGLDTTQNGSGAAFNMDNSNPVLKNLVIKNNIAQFGGAVNCYQSNPDFYNVKIIDNAALQEGGGINCNQASPLLKNCVISYNKSNENGGGLTIYDNSSPRIINSVITKNKAGLGGGAMSIYDNCSPKLTNITVVGNQANQSSGIQSKTSTPTIINSIIWNKSYFDNATISYSDIKGGWTGISNIDSYPEFQDTTTANYSLKCASPCLNSGNPDTSGLETESNDILGNPRIFDKVIDMGAFEYQGTAIPGKPGFITGDTAVCQGSVNVNYSVLAIPGATSYIWTLPTGATWKSSDNSISVNFDSTSTSGNIKVMGNNVCGSGTESTLAVTVNDIPETPTITLKNGILYSDYLSGNQWYEDSLTILNAVYDTLAPTQKGDYYVIITLNNCSSYPSNSISFSPLGISEIFSSNKIKVYPNPTTGLVEISVVEPLGIDIKIELINTYGKVIKPILKNKNDYKFDLDLRGYPSGVYLIRLRDSQRLYFLKILKL